MDIEEKHLIEEIAGLTRENNTLLKKIHRGALWGRVWRIIYWVIILGVAFGALYFLQPYVEQVRALYRTVQTVQEQAGIFLPGFGNTEPDAVE
ncbi:hypothetical protein L0Y40_02675 [Candidatus Wolfebacteria bacterium]|nr:hypothetical protein [Candidatus Wolfebacteria bacterium]